MADKSIKGLYEDLPATVKLIVIVTALIVVFILARRAFKFAQTYLEAQDTQTEIKALKQAGVTPSYPDSTYLDLANKLYNSMDGPGTWDDDLDDVFSALNNDLDFVKLKSAYGLKEGYTMQEWLDGDLSEDRKSAINAMMSAKGITYRI